MYIWRKGRAAGRVGSDQTFCRQSRVGSGRVNVSPARVGSKKSDPWTTLGWSDGNTMRISLVNRVPGSVRGLCHIIYSVYQGRIQEFILGGAKPKSPIESWGRSPNRGREAPEYRGRSPSPRARSARELRAKPEPRAKPEKKRGEGSGEGARWAPP